MTNQKVVKKYSSAEEEAERLGVRKGWIWAKGQGRGDTLQQNRKILFFQSSRDRQVVEKLWQLVFGQEVNLMSQPFKKIPASKRKPRRATVQQLPINEFAKAIEREAQIIKCCLDPDFADELDKIIPELKDDDIYKPSHQEIWKSICNIYPEKFPEYLHVLEDIQKRLGADSVKPMMVLSEIQDLTEIHVVNVGDYVKKVKQAATRRKVAELSNAIYKKANQKNVSMENIKEATGQLIQLFDEAASGIGGEGESCITLADIYNDKEEEPPAIMGEFIRADDQTIIWSKGGVGKSLIGQNMALHSGSGKKNIWDMFEINICTSSLFVQSENSRYVLRDRARQMCNGDADLIPGLENVFYMPGPVNNKTGLADLRISGKMTDLSFRRKIIEFAEKVKNEIGEAIGVILWDPLISFHEGNENENAAMRTTLDLITEVSGTIGATPIVKHHANKSGEMRAATAIWDWARSIIKLENADYRGQKRIIVTQEKSNNARLFEPFRLTMDENLNFEGRGILETVPDKKRLRSLKVVEALEILGGSAETKNSLVEQYMEITGLKSATTIHRHIDDAVKLRLIKREYCQADGIKKARYFIDRE